MLDASIVYNEFKELTPSKIHYHLDDELGLYEKYIEPVNNELNTEGDKANSDRINIIFRLILWDELFYNKYEFEATRLTGIYKRKQFVDAILPIVYNPQKFKKTYKVLNSILGKWPDIRDFIFKNQKEKLDSCESPNDYVSFIKSKPYPEYALFAKYKLSLLNKTPFDDANFAIDNYPNSDVLPIKALQSLFQSVNGIRFMWKGYAANMDLNINELKEDIVKIISGSRQLSTAKNAYIQAYPVNYSLLRNIVLSGINHSSLNSLRYELYLHDCANKEKTKDNNAVISRLDLFENIALFLNSLISGVKFTLPNLEDIQKEASPYIDYLWVNNKTASNSCVAYHCLDGQIYPESRSMYAGCRLLLNTKE